MGFDARMEGRTTGINCSGDQINGLEKDKTSGGAGFCVAERSKEWKRSLFVFVSIFFFFLGVYAMYLNCPRILLLFAVVPSHGHLFPSSCLNFE